MTYHKVIKSLLLSCLLAFANDLLADDDGTWTYTLSGDEATITGCVATCPTELAIPSTVDGYGVTSIGDYAFSYIRLTSVTIPGSVTSISRGAFQDNQLTSVTIPDSVTSIGDDAFWLNELTSVAIPDSLTSIGVSAFADNQLTSITIPESVTRIGSGAFYLNQLTSVLFLGHAPLILSGNFQGNPLDIVPNSAGFAGNPLEIVAYCTGKDGFLGIIFIEGITPVADCDNDGVEDSNDAFPLDSTEIADTDSDGVGDNKDAFPNDSSETLDTDGDTVGDNADAFPLDACETVDTDGDGLGNNADPDDDNDNFTDEQELVDGTDPFSRFSCKSGCFSFDVDESLEAQPLTDGLLVIRHLFGFSGDSLTSGAVSGGASRGASDAIASYLTDADSQLDIDGDGESKPLTDGLLLIRYLFGFSGDSLISGAIGTNATRNTADAVETYIKERVPAD